MKINILGTQYTISEHRLSDDKKLEGLAGYMDKTSHEIVLRKEHFIHDPNNPRESKDLSVLKKKVLRHEITHAFFEECGLEDKYVHDEKLVELIAKVGPKLFSIWEQAKAL